MTEMTERRRRAQGSALTADEAPVSRGGSTDVPPLLSLSGPLVVSVLKPGSDARVEVVLTHEDTVAEFKRRASVALVEKGLMSAGMFLRLISSGKMLGQSS